MIPIHDFLNKIKWDKRLIQKDYKIYYFDRKINKNIEISFAEIKEISKNFMTVEKDLKELDIPLHRIREVRKRGKLVWARHIQS